MTVHIFDIDNTLANNSERSKIIENDCNKCTKKKFASYCHTCNEDTGRNHTQEAWDRFTDPSLYVMDTPFPGSQEYMEVLCSNPTNIIFYVTGRNEKGRAETEEWLKMYYPEQYYSEYTKVYMRRPEQYGGGHSPASQYKEDAIKWLIRKHNLVNEKFVFYEDDGHVIPMYKKYGVVFQCPHFWDTLNVAGLHTGEPLVKG